jgi:hypothetical protein
MPQQDSVHRVVFFLAASTGGLLRNVFGAASVSKTPRRCARAERELSSGHM